MDEYIDRLKLIEAMEAYQYDSGKDGFGIMTLIGMQPTADVVPVKHGEWIEDGYDGKENVCSHCGSELPLKSESGKIPKKQVNFCYYCSAKMDLKEETK